MDERDIKRKKVLELGLREWKGDGYMQWTYSELTMAIIWKGESSKMVVRMKQILNNDNLSLNKAKTFKVLQFDLFDKISESWSNIYE